jgi:YHS domain-containing protein
MSTLLRFATVLSLILMSACHSGEPVTFQDASGAIRGYDPVAYILDGKPVKGKPELNYRWNGADWHFSTPENLARFKEDPIKYAPQYGGYCADGTAEGHKAPTEPDAFTVLDGKLYLNYNKEVLAIWSKDIPGYIRKADSNWTRLRDK